LFQDLQTIVHLHIQNSHDLRILDIGCRNKSYYPVFAPYTSQYLGIDISDDPAGPDCLGSADSLPFPDETFDVVFCNWVIIYVENVAKVLHEARRCLRPGGLMILTTHGMWPLLGKPNYWRFSRDGVEHILTGAGFRVSRVVSNGGPALSLFQLLNLYVDLLARGKLVRVASPMLYFASNLLGEALDNRIGGREGWLSCEDYTSIAYSVNYIGIGRKGS
jgi:SAM-dependent methyltransferase